MFATSDGIWAIFYAILDRSAPALAFMNAALQFASTARPAVIEARAKADPGGFPWVA